MPKNDMDVGTKVRLLRLRQSLSMTDLAGRCGLALSTISCIEAGAKKPRQETLEKLAYALGVAPDELVNSDTLPVPDANSLVGQSERDDGSTHVEIRIPVTGDVDDVGARIIRGLVQYLVLRKHDMELD